MTSHSPRRRDLVDVISSGKRARSYDIITGIITTIIMPLTGDEFNCILRSASNCAIILLPSMSFPYKKILVIGATSGIGEALADRFIGNGISVVAVGRRKENLDAFVSRHGNSKASSVVFDVTDHKGTPKFVKQITQQHLDIDCVFLNSGIQRGFNFGQPESIDLDLLETEMDTNYTSFLHLTVAFTPFLQSKSTPAAFIYTTSGLALVPMARCPNYCASKAALHHWILTLRDQLAEPPQGRNPISVIEIYPPAVQTELHDEKHQPDIKNGRSIGMPLKDFTDDSWAQLSAGKDQVPAGFVKDHFKEGGLEAIRQQKFQGFKEMIKKSGH
ncbi:MAG: hypothetical protein M1820_007513 [Bogoriella megaspora]|nr:MAG: hypothetical protein M1820_007513 [Bogoriella megaspora]